MPPANALQNTVLLCGFNVGFPQRLLRLGLGSVEGVSMRISLLRICRLVRTSSPCFSACESNTNSLVTVQTTIC